MRYLPIYARPATAHYIVDNELDAPVRPQPWGFEGNAPLPAWPGGYCPVPCSLNLIGDLGCLHLVDNLKSCN